MKLLIYTACKHIQVTIETLITNRHEALKIQHLKESIDYQVIRSGEKKDPGIYYSKPDFLAGIFHAKKAEKMMIVLDQAWDNSPCQVSICNTISDKIKSTGISENTFKVIVIAPELEQWMWNLKLIGFADCFSTSKSEIDDYARKIGFDFKNKPSQPKELFEKFHSHFRKPYSAASFKKIAGICSVEKCNDKSFLEFKTTLQSWFPKKA
jgi:hypothetical protein